MGRLARWRGSAILQKKRLQLSKSGAVPRSQRAHERPVNASHQGTAQSDGRLPATPVSSANFLHVPRLPCLVKERLLRPIETENDKESFPRNRLEPVFAAAFGCIRAEVHVN